MPVYKDSKTNTWYYSFRKKINDSIINKKGRGYRTKIEAQKAEFETLKQLTNDEDSILKKQKLKTINDIFTDYIDHVKTKLKITTLAGLKERYKTHIQEQLGYIALTNITKETIKNWKTELIKKDYTEKFTNEIIRLLRTILSFAIKRNNIKNNNLIEELEKVNLYKLVNERKVWTLEQFNTFIDTFDKSLGNSTKDMKEYFTALFYSGMRPNEFRCLQKKDIQGNYLNVCKNISSKISNKDIIMTTKNKNSVRKVLMPEFIINMLNERTQNYNENDFIFGKEKCYRETTIRRYLAIHTKLAKLPSIVIYGFRHSHATHLIRSGIPIKIVSKRLGHKDASTTMNVYWHLFKDDEELVLNAFKI